MTLALSTERPDPNVCPIADAEIVTVTESSPQDLQAVYDREVDIEAETTSNPVNTACPYDPDKDPDTPPTPPEDDPEPEPEPETIHVTVTAGSANICHNATELPELTQSVSPEIPGGSLGSPTVPDWTPETHDPSDTFPVIPGTWTPPDDGKNYEITYVNGVLTVIHCAVTHHVTVTADSKNVCIDAESLPELTQTVIIDGDESEEGSSTPPTVPDYSPGNHNIGDRIPIIPGTWTPPDDGDIYEITYVNGTLTVLYCDPGYEIELDAQVCPEYLSSNDGKYYVANNAEGTLFTGHSTIGTSDNLKENGVTIYIAAILKITSGNNDPNAINQYITFNVNYSVDGVSGQAEAYAYYGFPSYTEIPINFSISLQDIRDLQLAYINGDNWSKTMNVSITVTESERGYGQTNYQYRKTFSLHPRLTKCPHDDESSTVCHHSWAPNNDPSDLWAGTATVE